MVKMLAATLALICLGASGNARAACTPPSSEACKNMKNVESAYKKQQQERKREAMRDKSHDNRLKVGRDSSIGISRSGVDVKKKF